MTPRARLAAALLAASLAAGVGARSQPAAPTGALHVAPPVVWARGLGTLPRMPLVGDVDGDGLWDIVSLWPKGKCWAEVALNAGGVKSMPPRRTLHAFGEDCVGATLADVDGKPGCELIGVFKDGTVRIAWNLAGRAEEGLWGYLSRRKVEKAWISLAHLGDRDNALLIAYPDGGVETARWRFPDEAGTTAEGSRALPARIRLAPRPDEVSIRGRSAGGPAEQSRFEVLWRDHSKSLFRRELDLDAVPMPTSGSHSAFAERIGPDDGFGLARFELGLSPRPEPESDDTAILGWPGASVLRGAGPERENRAAYLRFRQDGDPQAGGDVLLYRTFRAGDPDSDGDGLPNAQEAALGTDPLDPDSDHDGLPDYWEVNGFRGQDLKALGCGPNHADVLVRITPTGDLDPARVRREMDRVVAYYASLPVTNRDGTRGIALHYVLDPPVDARHAASRPWWAIGDEGFPNRLRGMWHWMLVTNAGGGQSDMLADRGSAGARALYATFIHEFGHQLGLSHDGFWPGGWCPAYPSLMNYAYSYQLGGDPNAIGYSTGKLAKLKFDERDLSERLPLPMKDVAFLAGPPYHWRLKADGDQTLVDWNWNGVFGEEHVRADINYGYSTTAGERQILFPPGRQNAWDEQDRTGHAPFLVSHGKALYLFYVEAPKDANADERMSGDERANAKPIPGRVLVRVMRKQGEWSAPMPVSEEQATGDPYAVSHEGRLWLFYPTADGIRAAALSADGRAIAEPTLIRDTKGAEVSAISWQKRLLLFLWTGPDSTVTARDWTGSSAGVSFDLGFKSDVPPGPCVDPGTGDLVLGCAAAQDEGRKSRFLVRRFALPMGRAGREDARPPVSLHETGREWLMGDAGKAAGTRRPTLIFEPLSAPKPEHRTPKTEHLTPSTRLNFIATGVIDESRRKSSAYVWTQIADKSVGGGWLQRRYYDEWTESYSAPAACWWNGDIAFASRWYGVGNRQFRDNGVFVAYHGLGVQSEPMGDFDDVGLIFNRGLAHSILYLEER